MENQCIVVLREIKQRVEDICKYTNNHSNGLHSHDMCKPCQAVSSLITDVGIYLRHYDDQRTGFRQIYHRTPEQDQCHHQLSTIQRNQIVFVHECGCFVSECSVRENGKSCAVTYFEPRVYIECIAQMQRLCKMISDIEAFHNETLVLEQPQKRWCMCQLFDEFNLYLTRTETYLKEEYHSDTPIGKLMLVLGDVKNTHGKLVSYLPGLDRTRDKFGQLLYLQPNETIVSPDDEFGPDANITCLLRGNKMVKRIKDDGSIDYYRTKLVFGNESYFITDEMFKYNPNTHTFAVEEEHGVGGVVIGYGGGHGVYDMGLGIQSTK